MELNKSFFTSKHYKCLNVDYSLLIISNEGIRLYGVFAFQILLGYVEANGFQCTAAKFNEKNFYHVSISVLNVPLFLNVKKKVNLNEDLLNVLTSRLRKLVDEPIQEEILSLFLSSTVPIAVVLIKHNYDFSSKFILQQYSEQIFKIPSKNFFTEIGNMCFYYSNSSQFQEIQKQQNSFTSEIFDFTHNFPNSVLDRIEKNWTEIEKKSDCGRIIVVGNKGVGKSTFLRYIINVLLSKSVEPNFLLKQIFLLDCDVGQSELTPPGLISLHEIKEPFLSASFASQITSFKHSFFFGSNSPAVDFQYYLFLIHRSLKIYDSLKTKNSILFINTVGWIEDLGYDLLCNLLKDVSPTLIINIQLDTVLNFDMPQQYRPYTCIIRRKNFNNEALAAYKKTPASLRNFSIAGYFSQCFACQKSSSSFNFDLADVIPYRVRFNSISIYFHSELSYVADRLVFSALNCAIVALCFIDFKNNEQINCFQKHRIFNNESLPERIIYYNNDTENYVKKKKNVVFPTIRCFGYGMIRAIDIERRLFYVITPVEKTLLNVVNVFALGHELQSPAILFNSKSSEPAPYLVEFGNAASRNHRKLFLPLKSLTGLKRNLACTRQLLKKKCLTKY